MGNTRDARDSGQFRIGGELPVHRLGFGAMRLTGKGVWGEPSDRRECIATLRRAVELGVTFIDTADSYGPDVSERIIAEALYPYAKNIVIATKAGLVRPGPGVAGERSSRSSAGSLRRKPSPAQTGTDRPFPTPPD